MSHLLIIKLIVQQVWREYRCGDMNVLKRDNRYAPHAPFDVAPLRYAPRRQPTHPPSTDLAGAQGVLGRFGTWYLRVFPVVIQHIHSYEHDPHTYAAYHASRFPRPTRQTFFADVELLTLLVVQPVGMCSCSRVTVVWSTRRAISLAMCSLLALVG